MTSESRTVISRAKSPRRHPEVTIGGVTSDYLKKIMNNSPIKKMNVNNGFDVADSSQPLSVSLDRRVVAGRDLLFSCFCFRYL